MARRNVPPAPYCDGFSTEACGRIMAAAEAKQMPEYCKPGLVAGVIKMSAELRRVCYARSNQASRRKSVAVVKSLNPSSQSKAYEITLLATASIFPKLSGSTNLPDGTKLFISIEKPRLPNSRERQTAGLPMCEDDCFPATDDRGVVGASVVVSSGAFAAGPFSWGGKPFRTGIVDVGIFLASLPDEGTGPGMLEKQLNRMSEATFNITVDVGPP